MQPNPVAAASQADTSELGRVAKKANLWCYKCRNDGFFFKTVMNALDAPSQTDAGADLDVDTTMAAGTGVDQQGDTTSITGNEALLLLDAAAHPGGQVWLHVCMRTVACMQCFRPWLRAHRQ